MKPKVIAVVGGKKVGKTTTTENLIKELTRRGLKVAAVKHISERDFTMDTPEKDTWRYAKAGAKTIIAVAPNEIAIIEKGATEKLTLETLLEKCEGNDVILIEGMKKLAATNQNIPKIIVVKTQNEATKALETYKPILAFSGPYNTTALSPSTPYADALKNPQKLATLIQNAIQKNKR
jgi:molybdopterin-guanine dinucleotide biosynthesis protein MobB